MSNHRRSQYTIPLLIAAVIVMMAAVIMWFKPDKQRTASTLPVSATVGEKAMDALPTTPVADQTSQTSMNQSQSLFVTGLERLPRSLAGTQIDGEIIIDENKQLVVTEGLRRLFDYFLSALGEEDAATIYARVASYIRHHVPEPAASQAVAIFDDYVDYLKAIPDIEKRYGNLQLQATKSGKLDLNTVAQQKQEIAKLRRQYFDQATITAFFGAEDNYDDYTIAMIEIEQNDQTSDEQKQAARQDYISRMPNNTTKANLVQQTNLNALITRTEQMKAQGASPEALYNMRRELVGEQAAARLAQVDQEDANFDQRFTQYEAQKQRILGQNADGDQANRQLAKLEQQLFSDTERKRLDGYAALQRENKARTQPP